MEFHNLKKLNVVFGGCARDCEKYIPKVMENIDLYSSFFNNCYKIVVENGSKDNTKNLLNKYKTKNDFIFIREDLSKYTYRGKRLEHARNFIIDTIRNNEILRSCDLFIALDFDDRNLDIIETENFVRAINFLISKEQIGAVFANQIGIYYDMWGLIDEKYCKVDFWVNCLKKIAKKTNPNEQISQEILNNFQKDLDDNRLSFDPSSEPIKVKSAYGGFGIYKIDKVLKNQRKYKGDQKVELIFKDGTQKNIFYQKNEIVNFNLGFSDIKSDLYILPYLINKMDSQCHFPLRAAFSLIINENSSLNI